MKVIALRGPSERGKSHTINIVYSLLLKIGYTQEQGHFKRLGGDDSEDIMDVLTLNGIRVGIIGMGDIGFNKSGGLDSLLAYLKKAECTIAICSCRKEKNIEKCVELYPEHVFIEKNESPSRDQDRIINYMDAERLVKEI
ncbi:MAG: hypothetical protein K2P88_00610 [Chitinophagaceae bacterium]|nr:hypothetical protein [Chitinophagaceae bacterium]